MSEEGAKADAKAESDPTEGGDHGSADERPEPARGADGRGAPTAPKDAEADDDEADAVEADAVEADDDEADDDEADDDDASEREPEEAPDDGEPGDDDESGDGDKSEDGGEETSHFESSYADYNKALRAWLLSYGVGGPIILATQDTLAATLARSHVGGYLSAIFFAGVFFQILSAFINKYANWANAHRAIHQNQGGQERPFHRLASRILDMMWIDVVCDLVTILCFAGATGWVIHLIASSGWG